MHFAAIMHFSEVLDRRDVHDQRKSSSGGRGRDRLDQPGHAGGDAPPVGERDQRVGVDGGGRQPVVDVGQGSVADDPHDDGGRREIVPRGQQLAPGAGAQVRVPAVQRLEQLLERAVTVEQGCRGLLADAGDAGQTVAGVTAQHGQVGVPGAVRHVVLRAEPRLVDDLEVPDAAADVEHADAGGVVDELEEIAVAGDDVDVRRPGGRGAGGEGAGDVVRLEAGASQAGDPEGGEDVDDDRDL